MGILEKWTAKPKVTALEDDTYQRSNSEALLRKPGAFAAPNGDGREGDFVIKAAPSPRKDPAPPGTAPPRAIYRSASVVVAPTHGGQQSRAGRAVASLPRRLLPEYKTSAQFNNKVELYKGSISTVFKAICTLTKTEVIIKQYIKSKMSARSTHKMMREVRLMQLLKQEEGVAQILGFFEDDHFYYIIMEHCAGGDLYHKLILNGEFDEHWTCRKIIAPLLRALHRIHTEFHVVHRDIKPENLFLTKEDELSLGDFGLAIKQDEELPFLRAGTLDYMAPEVIANQIVNDIDEAGGITAADLQIVGLKPYDEKVDVWAVGILAFELLMGDAPFYHTDEKETAKLIQQSNTIPFPAHQRLSQWANFVRAALVKDPRKRPSACQLLEHPWIKLHDELPLFRQPDGRLGVRSRAGNSKHAAVAAAAAADSKPHKQPAQQQQQQQQQQPPSVSVRIQVDATGAAAAAGAASTAAGAAASLEPAAQVAQRISMDGSVLSGSGRGSCCWQDAVEYHDDLMVDKRVSMVGLRRTRNTGEAGLEMVHHHRASHAHHRISQLAGGLAGRTPRASALPCAPCSSHHTTTAAVPAVPAALAASAGGYGAEAEAEADAEVVEAGPQPGEAFVLAAAASGLEKEASADGLGGAGGTKQQQRCSSSAAWPARSSSGSHGAAQPAGTARPALPAGAPTAVAAPAARESGRGSRLGSKKSQASGDALDAFAAQQQSQQQQEEGSEEEGEEELAVDVAPQQPNLGHLAPCRLPPLAQPDTAAAALGAASPPTPKSLSGSALLASAACLGTAQKDAAPAGPRPKSNSLPKSPFTSKAYALFGGGSSDSRPRSSEVSSETCTGGVGSRVLAAWGREPSRLSVAAKAGAAAATQSSSPAAGPEQAQAGAKLGNSSSGGKKPSAGWSNSGSNMGGTQDEVQPTRSRGGPRWIHYLTRQRGA